MAMMPIAAGLLMPVALLSYWLVRGLVNDQVMAPLAAPVWNSVTVSLMAAGVTVAAAIPVAVLSVRYRSLWTRLLERVTYIGFGLPGVVVALSLVFFGVNVALFLYQTTWMLVFAYMVLFLPAAMGAVRSSLLQVSPRVEEAAASLGRSPWQVFSSVTFPLVMPGVLSGAALVFLLTMKELPATLILSPIGFKTLSTAIWSAATEAFFARTAAASLLLIVVSGVPTAYFVLRRQERGSS
jgi:iron(III) transport system permease protein